MREECYTCGQDISGQNPHDCPMAKHLDEAEQIMVNALMDADFCDHWCCGLSPVACKAKAIVVYLKEHGLLKGTIND